MLAIGAAWLVTTTAEVDCVGIQALLKNVMSCFDRQSTGSRRRPAHAPTETLQHCNRLDVHFISGACRQQIPVRCDSLGFRGHSGLLSKAT